MRVPKSGAQDLCGRGDAEGEPRSWTMVHGLRNLLLGEDNVLKNRFMHIDWVDEQEDAPLNGVTEQVTEQVGRLLIVLGEEELSAAELMQGLELKHRPTFFYSYLHPAAKASLAEPPSLTSSTAPNSATAEHAVDFT